MMNYRMLSLGVLALALFVGAPARAAKDAEEATHEGKVVSVTGTSVTMTDKGGKEHSHTLAAGAKLSLDGKACKAEDFKAGMKIRVTTMTNDPKVATRIEAIDKVAAFAKTHDGKVISMTNGKLVMTGKDGKEHSHSVSADAKLTLDGKACKAEDLKAGMKIRVTTAADQGVAVGIEAIDQNPEFAQRS
jgi:hypothetical protein